MRKLLFAVACCMLLSVISGFQPKLFGQRRSTFLTAASSSSSTSNQKIQVGELVGSGSYGTVHLLQVGDKTVIGKRPWLENELVDQDKPKERATRCRYYWQVEEHVFSKLRPHPQLPPYLGPSSTSRSGECEWMLFEIIGHNKDDDDGTGTTPAPTLSDLMKLDAADQNNPLALPNICQALSCDSYADALDRILVSLMTVLAHVHDSQIVHRDVKPSNLLVHNGTLVLMDFGSAADLEPTKGDFLRQRRKGLEDEQRVAVSPIYTAPEIFIDLRNHPLGFDIFSSGLLFCQFVLCLLDERMDAGFHQQLEETDWDLNAWLSNELASDLRPRGLTQALEYLAARQGLWTLLEDMLAKDPSNRPSAKQTLRRFQVILKEEGPPDGPYFEMVIESMESCEIIADEVPAVSRPLHFVATFSRKQPLGLVLSEQDEEYESPVWKESTKEAEQGEVFVKELVEGGQAEEFGIFEVGDRLSGIGELAFRYGGFERAVEMLQVQPKKAANVKLHFDRLSVRVNSAIPMIPSKDVELQIAASGAWSSKGRRKAQEDAFVLHEIHNTEDRSVLVAGIMDGHGGTAASTMVAEQLPNILNTELVNNRLGVTEALESAWGQACNAYRQQCNGDGGEECRADYDPVSGLLMANTGSNDLIAGTTASIMALDEHTGKLTFLNCGDSRCVLVDKMGKVIFATRDHKPQEEEKRFQKRKDDGLDYSLPQCSVSRWSISVGDYVYSVSRSLEGPFATSKGIISDPDVTTVQVESGMMMVSASDGIWDVMDSSEVAMDLFEMRQKKTSARDAAKELCNMAWNKGTSDNISAVVVYL